MHVHCTVNNDENNKEWLRATKPLTFTLLGSLWSERKNGGGGGERRGEKTIYFAGLRKTCLTGAEKYFACSLF
jgi:hypothetical protein